MITRTASSSSYRVWCQLALFSALLAATLQAENRSALLMGVWDYSEASFRGNAIPSLPGIENDLRLMETALRKAGFTDITVVKNPSVTQAKRAVDAFSAKLKTRKGTGLFYFSGHGGEFEGKNYLIPKRALIGTAPDLGDEALNAQRVLNGMEASGTAANLVFLDCCRNDLGKSITGADFARMQARGSFIGFATRTGELADPGNLGSPYTRFLAENLTKPGVSIYAMHTAVTKQVKDHTKRKLGVERTPGFYSELSDVFYFVLPGLSTAEEIRPGSASKSQPFINSLGMKFVPVTTVKRARTVAPGIVFEEKKVLFSIWETRVQDYAAYAKANPGVDMEWKDYAFGDHKQGPDHPVVKVSYEDAEKFCAWLSRQDGSKHRYRLPTDHEWSLAVGIGQKEDALASPKSKDGKIEGVYYPWGSTWPPPRGAGNFNGQEGAGFFGKIEGYTDSHPFTAPVGSYQASPLGLFDLSGNVYEWCQDWYDPSAQKSRVLRGGSWGSRAEVYLRSSNRLNYTPSSRSYGFRCVLEEGVGG